ncbi:threonine synthase [Polynucleobacter sp. SHI8]|uniref:threonine synthase n=1 Tax=unclassified Polynucleobacter TaxID=2640945 RepID=UPI0024908CB0|nr:MULTISPECIES: threonine synthase [unclassified Polynucleobacter]BDW10772.1 threonine synthase [Polynucleobacter sp. SHI2]BDW13218.1 threonine synthase [Polynucleobacter sp. SHI8]
MKYVSTRGGAEQLSFLEILLAGLAPDGGLYMPASYPQISSATLDSWRKLSYADLAFEVLRLFSDDIPEEDLRQIVRKTYTSKVYCNGRADDDATQITPVHWFGEEAGTQIGLLSLSNGPTLAFKDMAMQLLGNLFEYALAKEGRELNILGATSGDTGSAAEYAMRGKKGIRVFMLSPAGKMSAFQCAQMYSLQDPNIFNIAIQGVFDDAQDIVKAVSNDLEFKSKYKIGTVNSINWARVVAQVVYYFAGYLRATSSSSEKVSFCVPSGNFGNVCAGHIARMMGLPIHQLVVATNENDVLDEFFKTGHYRARKSAETFHTSSPSMDISKASNFERFVFDWLERDGSLVKDLFAQVEQHGGFDYSQHPARERIQQFGFVSGRSTHTNRIETIQQVSRKYGVVIDTHTADGVQVARNYLQPGIKMLVLETALPVKFSETIETALGYLPDRPDAFVGIEDLPQRIFTLSPQVNLIKEFIIENTQ